MRRWLRRLSLRARLLVITALLLLAGLSLISAIVSNRLENYQVDRVDDRLRSFTSLISRTPEIGLEEIESSDYRPQLVEPGLDAVGAPMILYLDADGHVEADLHSSTLDDESLPSRADLREVPADGEAVSVDAGDGSGRWRVVARSTKGRQGTVLAAAPLMEADDTMDRLRATSMVSGAAVLVLLTAVGWFALGRGLRPLRRIEHTAATIADGDLTERVPALAPP
ncbi:MAG: HAMP domain-containing protein, partial [Actinomycetia bacterium]|nr:HAMP domain-containing protein [Actinomycetes bacterium]